MTVKEIKEIIKLNSKDEVVYIKNDERVQAEDNDIVLSIQGSGDWDGYVTYNVVLK